MAIVELVNIHFNTDETRPEGITELQCLMRLVRHYFHCMEPFRELVIKDKCSNVMDLRDGFLGSLLNGLEQIDLEKLEEEIRAHEQQ